MDLVEVARVARVLQRHPVRFLTRHFTPAERDQCGRDPHRLATRWSAKEATAKALGTGIGPVAWTEIEILGDFRGAPQVHLHGCALRVAQGLGIATWAVSLSDTHDHAIAVVAGIGAR